MQRSMRTLTPPPPFPVRGRIDGESWGDRYLFTVDFLANPLKLCAVNSSNTWVLIVFIFVEFMSSYLLSARRIQNVGLRSPLQMRNARITSYSWCRVLVVYWKLIAISVSRKVHNTNPTWPFFDSREKMVNSEPSNLT
jgi:hypothetical protein